MKVNYDFDVIVVVHERCVHADGDILVVPRRWRKLAPQVSRYGMLFVPRIRIELRARPQAGFFVGGFAVHEEKAVNKPRRRGRARSYLISPTVFDCTNRQALRPRREPQDTLRR